MVRAVHEQEPDELVEDDARFEYTHGPALTTDEVNAEILVVLGTDVTLRAVEHRGRIVLSDGVNSPAEGNALSLPDLMDLLYEYAVFIGYTCENFEDFIAYDNWRN